MSSAHDMMPRYQCHKRVHALKLVSVGRHSDGSCTLFPHDSQRFAPVLADAELASRVHEQPGDSGYLVIYEDGYRSWSPTKAFEDGYTLLTDP